MLEWNWLYAEHIEFFKQKFDIGLPTPLDFAPVLDRYQMELWNAFVRLDSTGMGGHKIPMSEMYAYANMFGITDVDTFVSAMNSMANKKLELMSNGNKN